MLFLEKTSPPPFWQDKLTDKQRLIYDKAYMGHVHKLIISSGLLSLIRQVSYQQSGIGRVFLPRLAGYCTASVFWIV